MTGLFPAPVYRLGRAGATADSSAAVTGSCLGDLLSAQAACIRPCASRHGDVILPAFLSLCCSRGWADAQRKKPVTGSLSKNLQGTSAVSLLPLDHFQSAHSLDQVHLITSFQGQVECLPANCFIEGSLTRSPLHPLSFSSVAEINFWT